MAMDPADVDVSATTPSLLGRMIGNAMSVNVLERLLYRTLPASGIISQSELPGRWESLDAARSTVRSFSTRR